jgi:hypothetical protein
MAACHLYPEGAQGHAERRPARALSQHCKHQRLNHLVSWAIWFFTSAGTNLQQAHGQRGQQTRASVSDPQPFAIAVLQDDTHF